ncbi:hypothetical protein RC77_17480 [Pectobacterium brasiliense]|nr:hypothetical protein RC77_17480 [Pectobacterium brasiliense]
MIHVTENVILANHAPDKGVASGANTGMHRPDRLKPPSARFLLRYDGLPVADPSCGKLPFHYLLFLVKAPGETDDVAWQ